jgi:hypothetical protein
VIVRFVDIGGIVDRHCLNFFPSQYKLIRCVYVMVFTLSHAMSYCRQNDLDILSTIIDREYLQV